MKFRIAANFVRRHAEAKRTGRHAADHGLGKAESTRKYTSNSKAGSQAYPVTQVETR